MILEVNATRMELLRLRKRLTLARRGYDLLKRKQDELMRRFLEFVETIGDLRKEIKWDPTNPEAPVMNIFKPFLSSNPAGPRVFFRKGSPVPTL